MAEDTWMNSFEEQVKNQEVKISKPNEKFQRQMMSIYSKLDSRMANLNAKFDELVELLKKDYPSVKELPLYRNKTPLIPTADGSLRLMEESSIVLDKRVMGSIKPNPLSSNLIQAKGDEDAELDYLEGLVKAHELKILDFEKGMQHSLDISRQTTMDMNKKVEEIIEKIERRLAQMDETNQEAVAEEFPQWKKNDVGGTDERITNIEMVFVAPSANNEEEEGLTNYSEMSLPVNKKEDFPVPGYDFPSIESHIFSSPPEIPKVAHGVFVKSTSMETEEKLTGEKIVNLHEDVGIAAEDINGGEKGNFHTMDEKFNTHNCTGSKFLCDEYVDKVELHGEYMMFEETGMNGSLSHNFSGAVFNDVEDILDDFDTLNLSQDGKKLGVIVIANEGNQRVDASWVVKTTGFKGGTTSVHNNSEFVENVGVENFMGVKPLAIDKCAHVVVLYSNSIAFKVIVGNEVPGFVGFDSSQFRKHELIWELVETAVWKVRRTHKFWAELVTAFKGGTIRSEYLYDFLGKQFSSCVFAQENVHRFIANKRGALVCTQVFAHKVNALTELAAKYYGFFPVMEKTSTVVYN